MYKLLLCWRYLKTRYLAFACIISVMLGVATLIVVNSVMNGFSTKLRTLLHSVLSDIVIEAHSMEGFGDPADKIARIRKDAYLDSQIDSMAITLDSFAMLQYRTGFGDVVTRSVRVTGVEMQSRSAVGGFHENLEHQRDSPTASFDIPEVIRKDIEENEKRWREFREFEQKFVPKVPDNRHIGIPDDIQKLFNDAKQGQPPAPPLPPPMLPPHVARVPKGAIVGHLIAHFKYKENDAKEPVERCVIPLGTRIDLTTVSSGERLVPVHDSFVVVDYFQSKMSEYDAQSVFVPLEHLQALRGMDNRATNILIKLKNPDEAKNVRDALGMLFAHEPLMIQRWEDKQGPLLRAIEIEKHILNILLFMIIAVAGFGILAIFSMIVSEKTRDIGVLKALGASSGGVMKIFLTYGLLLGVVGSLCGTILGLSITWNINAVENFIAMCTGSHVFSGDVYYFNEIPTDVQPMAIAIVNLGAVGIAVVFSILPALRAAMLHPVNALRYE
jgi:lipoprotein-releasing system permease protein